MRRSAGRAIVLALALTWCLVAPARALDPTRSISQFYHTAWIQRDGMPGNIWAITQTTDGFLWLGTSGGLYRFDGVRVERIDHFGAHRLPFASIRALLGSSNGDLWVGYEEAGAVSRVHDGELITYTRRDGLEPGGVWGMTEDSTHGVWILVGSADMAADALQRFDGRMWRRIDGDFGNRFSDASRGVWAFAAAGDGTIWAKNGETLFYYRPGMARFEAAAGYSGRVMGFARAPDGRLWTADQNATRFYPLPDLSRQSGAAFPAPVLNAGVPETMRGYIIIDQNGTMWCANQRQGGVSRIRSFTNETAPVGDFFSASDGLTSDHTHAVFEDREGNIWIGTDLGLDRFRPADIVREPRIPIGFTGPQVVATGDAIYVYTGVWRSPASRTGHSSLYRVGMDGEPRVVVEELGELVGITVHDNDLIIGRRPPHEGLFLLRGGQRLERLESPSAESASDILSNVMWSQDTLWYARGERGYFRFEGGREAQVLAKSSPTRPRLSGEWRGRPWLYYADHTIYEIDGDRVREQHTPDLGNLNTWVAMRQRVLIGGQLGLFEWNGSRFRTLPTSREPMLSAISDIAVTRDDNFWIVTQAGLVRTSLRELDRALADPSARLRYRLFDFRDGLPGAYSVDTGNGSVPIGPDGRLWLVTAGGLAWIDPNHLAHNNVPPPVAITTLRTGDAVFEMPSDLHLAPGSSNIQIDYTALSLVIPERNRFRYRLDGVDGDWVDAGDRREAFYTRLAPGDYQFRVIAANNDGVWNTQGATLAFTIAPTFLQSIWFKFILALAAFALLAILYAFRVRQVTAQLQGRFDARTAERERIARELHDTLLQGFQGLLLRFQSIANRAPADSDFKGALEDALNRADSVLVEGRARVRDLRSTSVDGDLSGAIVDTALNIIEGETPRFKLTVEGAPRELHGLVREEVLRVADQAIGNARQHAQASAIEAILSYGRSELRLNIRDDGVGMPAAVIEAGAKEGHYGLVGMHERAQRIGGQLHVSSKEGGGTEIRLTVPSRAAYASRRARGLWFQFGSPKA